MNEWCLETSDVRLRLVSKGTSREETLMLFALQAMSIFPKCKHNMMQSEESSDFFLKKANNLIIDMEA